MDEGVAGATKKQVTHKSFSGVFFRIFNDEKYFVQMKNALNKEKRKFPQSRSTESVISRKF